MKKLVVVPLMLLSLAVSVVVAPSVTAQTAEPEKADENPQLDRQTIALGQGFALAIQNDGSLWAWGVNDLGQLGDGTTIRRPEPVHIKDNVIAVSAGAWHTLALTQEGYLYTWGVNAAGQLGDPTAPRGRNQAGHQAYRPYPVRVQENIIFIHAGPRYSLAMTQDNHLWRWGAEAPNQIDQINRTGILTADGNLYAWQLFASRETDPLVVMSHVLHYTSSRAITRNGDLYVWGANGSGQLGLGFSSFRKETVPTRLMYGVVDVVSQSAYNMALTADGRLWTWGDIRAETDSFLSSIRYTPTVFMENILLPRRAENILATTGGVLPQPPRPVLEPLIPTPVQSISDEGLSLAIDFLADFHPLFHTLGVIDIETLDLYVHLERWEITPATAYHEATLPAIFVGRQVSHLIPYYHGFWWDSPVYGFFDRYGNEIKDVPFTSEMFSFQIYDLDHDGIPEIVITSRGWHGSMVRHQLFRFIDGIYQEILTVPIHYAFFTDAEGQLFVLHDENAWGIKPWGYYRLTFTESMDVQQSPLENVTLTPYLLLIDLPTYDIRTWFNHHLEPYFSQQPIMFHTGTPLARFWPLTDVHELITASVLGH